MQEHSSAIIGLDVNAFKNKDLSKTVPEQIHSATLKKKQLNLQEDSTPSTLLPPSTTEQQLLRNQTVVIQSEQNSPIASKGGYFGAKTAGLDNSQVKKQRGQVAPSPLTKNKGKQPRMSLLERRKLQLQSSVEP